MKPMSPNQVDLWVLNHLQDDIGKHIRLAHKARKRLRRGGRISTPAADHEAIAARFRQAKEMLEALWDLPG